MTKKFFVEIVTLKIISGFESYAAKVIYENKGIELAVEKDLNIDNVVLKGIDYKKFKLFLLSILWRASISKEEMFKDVDLGGKYEEVLRKMIFEGNPGKRDEFPISIFGIQSNENLVLKSIVAPRRLKENGNTCYMFFINGLFYYFNVSSFGMADMFNRVSINEDNEMTIGILKNKLGENFLDRFVGKKLRLSRKF
jgi:hypothetical protein